jgi:hypothetical protein
MKPVKAAKHRQACAVSSKGSSQLTGRRSARAQVGNPLIPDATLDRLAAEAANPESRLGAAIGVRS